MVNILYILTQILTLTDALQKQIDLNWSYVQIDWNFMLKG